VFKNPLLLLLLFFPHFLPDTLLLVHHQILATYLGAACFQFPSLEEKKFQKRNGDRGNLTLLTSWLHLSGLWFSVAINSFPFCSYFIFCSWVVAKFVSRALLLFLPEYVFTFLLTSFRKCCDIFFLSHRPQSLRASHHVSNGTVCVYVCSTTWWKILLKYAEIQGTTM